MTTAARGPRHRDAPPPKTGGSESDVLRAFLDYLRDSIIRKVETAPEPDVRTAHVASGTTLLGLLKHLAHVEEAVFLGRRPTNWAATFRCSDADTIASVSARYRAAIEDADAVLDACDDLSLPISRSDDAERPRPSVRWALTHMIEETGRHAGHIDILRELIDHTTGR